MRGCHVLKSLFKDLEGLEVGNMICMKTHKECQADPHLHLEADRCICVFPVLLAPEE